jgi:mRNA-degrading endonuclease RelE of RelBE toxin-antitoxin system
MRHEIILSPEAVADLGMLKANVRALVRDALEQYLRNEPAKLSRSRIKRLRGYARPQYHLRIGDDIRRGDCNSSEIRDREVARKAW